MMTKEEALYKVVADLKHRIAMVKEDADIIRKFIYEQGLDRHFEYPSETADECWANLNNIEIACDLDNYESLKWTSYAEQECSNDWCDFTHESGYCTCNDTMENIIVSFTQSELSMVRFNDKRYQINSHPLLADQIVIFGFKTFDLVGDKYINEDGIKVYIK